MSIVISSSGLKKSFRRIDVLRGLDIELERGDRVALVGSNGAGKTTLFRCLLGEYCYEGNLSVLGMEPRRQRAKILSSVGFVPQLPPPLKMPVKTLIDFASSICNSSPEKMAEVAGQLGLSLKEIGDRQFYRLSGGQKQKLLISIALGRDCAVLIMDEPAANLDPEARRVFFQLLEHRQHEAAMIISSHRLSDVASLVNRVLELDSGMVVLDDRVNDAIELSHTLACDVEIIRADDAFAQSVTHWGFENMNSGKVWRGDVAGPDRLRFLGMLSRYAAILGNVSMRDKD